METLVWLHFTLTVLVTAFLTYKITSWFYKRKIKKLEKQIADKK